MKKCFNILLLLFKKDFSVKSKCTQILIFSSFCVFFINNYFSKITTFLSEFVNIFYFYLKIFSSLLKIILKSFFLVFFIFDYFESPQATDSLSSFLNRFLFFSILLIKIKFLNFISRKYFTNSLKEPDEKRLNELKVSPFLVERLAVFYFFFKVLFYSTYKKNL